MSEQEIEIREARADEAHAITDLLEPYVAQEIVLPRTADEIRQQLPDFMVACAGRRIVGAVALRSFGKDLCEVRSLVVHPECAGQGLGTRLVHAAVAMARNRGAKRVFALTMRPRLFERLHFLQVDMSMFPQKVWSDCIKCPKRYRCDEVAVLLDLTDQDRD